MPTENRSSNTEMVSDMLPCPFCGQQDFLIERLDSDASVVICQGLVGAHEACLARGPVGVAQDEGEEQPGRDKAVELWNARAEQHQGEPVTLPACKAKLSDSHDWDQGYRGGWRACLDEIAKLGPLYTRPVQGEPVARVEVGADRNACVTITDNNWLRDLKDKAAHQVVPLYTHADPGEVERLREGMKYESERSALCLEELQECESQRDEFYAEITGLRSQLAEQKQIIEALCEGTDGSTSALLRIGRLETQLAEREALLRDKSGDLIRMAAHLISAPLFALQDLQDEDKKMTRARVDHAVDVADARLKDAAYELRRIADALSASAEPGGSQHKLAMDAACGEIEILRTQLAALPEKLIAAIDREQERLSAEDYLMDSDDCIKVIRETVSASAEPSAPVECGERTAFEKRFKAFNLRRHPIMQQSYENDHVDGVWLGWQARAALERNL